jgi:Pyruvate/2-oxoacid:ferredoxin oxidoreductase delta subunit
MYAVAKVDVEKCTGCKLCIYSCPDPNVLTLIKKAKKVKVNENRCKGCGLCVSTCPKEALAVSGI